MSTTYRGTWEEIVKHADDFRGKRVRVFVIDPVEKRLPPLTDQEEDERQTAMQAMFAEADAQAELPSPGHQTKHSPLEGLEEKHQRQRLDA